MNDARQSVDKVLDELIQLAPGLHAAGTFSAHALRALARHAAAAPVEHSVETGSGASTLLLSHVSPDHTVFAMDGGTGSVRRVENSPLLYRAHVTFVEGPTQLTLPRYEFRHPLQLALIDGPHAYPFPDLEYYFLYPHLDRGALLIVDDIHIPTITNLYDFLVAEAMFDLQEVVETTAFFRRTAAPLFSPTSDGWETQGYNRALFDGVLAKAATDSRAVAVDAPPPFFIDQIGASSDPSRVPPPLRAAVGESLVVRGWAIDGRRDTPAAAVHLSFDGRVYSGPVGVPRGDVVAAYGSQAYLRCGFNLRLPGELLTAGAHDLEVRIVFSGGVEYYPAATFRLVVA